MESEGSVRYGGRLEVEPVGRWLLWLLLAGGAAGLSCQIGGLEECGDGTCVPRIWLCDGRVDCDNAWDEAGCLGDPRHPRSHLVQCVPPGSSAFEGRRCGNVCLTPEQLCDGLPDCHEGEDEKGCRDDHLTKFYRRRRTAPRTFMRVFQLQPDVQVITM